MSDQVLIVSKFYGGIAQAEKVGLEGAYGNDSEFLDTTKDPNQLTVLPAGSKVSGSTVTGLIKWIVDGSPYDTNRYFYDENGVIYKETSGGAWSIIRSVTNSHGQGMALINDYLYYAQDNQIGRYGPLSGAPTFNDSWQTGLTNTSATGFAPIMPFAGGFAVGHGNLLAWWDGTIWTLAKLTLPPGFNIRALTQVQEFIVGAMWRSDATAITDSEDGYVFFWDSAASNANYFFPTDGAPNAIGNTANKLLSILGVNGSIYTDTQPFNLVSQIPKMVIGKYMEIFPGAVTTWKGQTYIGSAANTDSTDIKHGIYTYGAKSSQFPDALNYAAKISTGTQTGTGVRIGALLGVGSVLYWSWKDGASYGVDRITSASSPHTTGKYVSLVHDDGRPGFDKMNKVLEVTHKALATGESIQLGGKVDRAASFTNDTANSTIGSQKTRYAIPASRYKEFEFQVLLGCGATAPTVTSINYMYDDLKQEELLT